jgi:1-acyl-sn-glycerol-3-phosphate acyltransferase
MRAEIDRFLRLLARTAMAVWFRDVQAVGLERVPPAGPVLIVASHFNGLLDPVLVAATTARVPRFLGAASFWRNPLLGRLLDLTGALPVYRRRQEGRTENNRSVFEACYGALASGEVVALFPEGITHDEPGLAPLRTGAARIALGGRQGGAAGLRIVPIGLVYSAKTRPRSRALVRVGAPIDLDAWVEEHVGPGADHGPDNVEAVRRLTDEIQRRLADAALDYDNADLALVAGRAAAVALRPAGAPRDWEPSLDDLERCARAIVAAPPAHQLAVIRAFVPYLDALALLGLGDEDVVAGDLTPAAVRWQVGQLAAVGVLVPAAAVGAAVNAPGLGLVWAAGTLRWSVPMRATGRLLAGVAGFPLSWVLLRWGLGHRRIAHPTLATLLAGPGCGLVALALAERLRALGSARVSVDRLREHSAVLPALHAERVALLEAVVAAVEAAGEPGAAGHDAQVTRRGREMP